MAGNLQDLEESAGESWKSLKRIVDVDLQNSQGIGSYWKLEEGLATCGNL